MTDPKSLVDLKSQRHSNAKRRFWDKTIRQLRDLSWFDADRYKNCTTSVRNIAVKVSLHSKMVCRFTKMSLDLRNIDLFHLLQDTLHTFAYFRKDFKHAVKQITITYFVSKDSVFSSLHGLVRKTARSLAVQWSCVNL